MADEKLVLVERFEELKTGMRVVADCNWCSKREVGVLGNFEHGNGVTSRGEEIEDDAYEFHGNCDASGLSSVGRADVRAKMVYRFASDLDADDQLAREENPYLSRSVIGTGGVDEVRVPAKERR